jgi:Arc/MetJ family transcription regulator
MRITVDIDESILNDLVGMMGETKKSPAVSRAVTEFVKRQKAKEFGRLLREGAFDYSVLNEEIEKYDA